MRISDWSSDVCSSDLVFVGVVLSGSVCCPGLPWRLPLSFLMLVRWGNPSPPNPPLEGEGFDRLFGYFVSVHAGARLSRNDDNPSCPSGDTRSRAIRSDRKSTRLNSSH